MTYDEIMGSAAKKMYAVNSVTKGYRYYKNLLLEKCYGMYLYEGLPNSLPAEQIEQRLIMNGWAGVFDHEKEGLVTAYGGISGIDMYYLPTDYVYAQPVLGSATLKIHKDCVIVWNSQVDQYERLGLWQLIQRYARMLADLDSSINIVVVNSRAMKMNVVSDQQTQKTVDRAMQQLELGERYTINQNSILDLYKAINWNDDKSTVIQQLVTVKEIILSDFFAEVGVNTSSDKKERMVTDEVTADNQMLTVNTDDLLTWRQKGVNEINDIFGTHITVKRNPIYNPTLFTKKEGDVNDITRVSPDNDYHVPDAGRAI